MKKMIRVIILSIVVIMAAAPFIFGYLFEKKFQQQIAYLQQSQDDFGIKVKLESYRRGWFQSTASITVTQTINTARYGTQVPPLIYHIDSVISHGPFIYSDGRFVFAYAYLESILHLPDMIRIFIPERGHGFMQIYSQLGFDGSTWTNHYNVESMDFFSMVTWDGLFGDITFYTKNFEPTRILNTMTFGKLTTSSYGSSSKVSTVQPIKYSIDATKDTKTIWNGVSATESAGFEANSVLDWGVSLKNLLIKSNYGASGNAYHYFADVVIDSIKLPSSFAISSISNIKYAVKLDNLDIAGFESLKEYTDLNLYPGAQASNLENYYDSVLNLFMAGSSFSTKLNFDSNLGGVSTIISLKMDAKPKTRDMIIDHLSGDMSARVSQSLLLATLKYYFSTPDFMQRSNQYSGHGTNPKGAREEAVTKNAEILTGKINSILANFVQLGYLVVDKNDYLIEISKKGSTFIINGKQLDNPQQLLDQVADAYHQLYGNHCYWMNSYDGKNKWQVFTGLTIDDCYASDGCSRGMGRSGGGCYKWAASANAKPEPWSADSHTNLQGASAPVTNNIVFKGNTPNNTVTVCTKKEDGTLDACVDFTSVTFNAPTEVVIGPSGTTVNITNSGNQTTSVCQINGNGGLYGCATVLPAEQFHFPTVPGATLVVPPSTNYTFYPGMDSGGNDITQRTDLIGNVDKLKEECNRLPNCMGFNTSGWLKSVIVPNNQWSRFSDNPNDGLYVKKSAAVQNNQTSINRKCAGGTYWDNTPVPASEAGNGVVVCGTGNTGLWTCKDGAWVNTKPGACPPGMPHGPK
jgi:hypothetical protein